ncbi:MAG: DUF1365 domain-containing protein [Geminicoccaceae bacterium]
MQPAPKSLASTSPSVTAPQSRMPGGNVLVEDGCLPGSEKPEENGSLYVGRVMHHRLQPKRHRFTYRTFTMLLDIDRLDIIDRKFRLFSVGRANLFSFCNEDHGAKDGRPLRPWVEAELEAAGIATRPARIHLLAMPRFLGYVFNPLSVYYCYDAKERLFATVYEVKNTFGEQHAYALATDSGSASPPAGDSSRIEQRCAKDFYVSPFIEAKATYRFRLAQPGDKLSVLIREDIDSGPLLIASLTGRRRMISDRQLAYQAVRHPFLTHKVFAAIHFEALRLWLKGIRLQPRPTQAQTQKQAQVMAARPLPMSVPAANPVEQPPGAV